MKNYQELDLPERREAAWAAKRHDHGFSDKKEIRQTLTPIILGATIVELDSTPKQFLDASVVTCGYALRPPKKIKAPRDEKRVEEAWRVLEQFEFGKPGSPWKAASEKNGQKRARSALSSPSTWFQPLRNHAGHRLWENGYYACWVWENTRAWKLEMGSFEVIDEIQAGAPPNPLFIVKYWYPELEYAQVCADLGLGNTYCEHDFERWCANLQLPRSQECPYWGHHPVFPAWDNPRRPPEEACCRLKLWDDAYRPLSADNSNIGVFTLSDGSTLHIGRARAAGQASNPAHIAFPEPMESRALIVAGQKKRPRSQGSENDCGQPLAGREESEKPEAFPKTLLPIQAVNGGNKPGAWYEPGVPYCAPTVHPTEYDAATAPAQPAVNGPTVSSTSNAPSVHGSRALVSQNASDRRPTAPVFLEGCSSDASPHLKFGLEHGAKSNSHFPGTASVGATGFVSPRYSLSNQDHTTKNPLASPLAPDTEALLHNNHLKLPHRVASADDNPPSLYPQRPHDNIAVTLASTRVLHSEVSSPANWSSSSFCRINLPSGTLDTARQSIRHGSPIEPVCAAQYVVDGKRECAVVDATSLHPQDDADAGDMASTTIAPSRHDVQQFHRSLTTQGEIYEPSLADGSSSVNSCPPIQESSGGQLSRTRGPLRAKTDPLCAELLYPYIMRRRDDTKGYFESFQVSSKLASLSLVAKEREMANDQFRSWSKGHRSMWDYKLHWPLADQLYNDMVLADTESNEEIKKKIGKEVAIENSDVEMFRNCFYHHDGEFSILDEPLRPRQHLRDGKSRRQCTSRHADLTKQDFLQRVQTLRKQIATFTTNLNTLSELHQRVLSSAGGHDRAPQQLDQLLAQTQSHVSRVNTSIQYLDRDLSRTTEGSARSIKTTQLKTLRTTFRRELDRFRALESDYQARYREQIARQYRIINPDATEHEVQQATEAGSSNEGVFQAALRQNKSGQASSVLGNVRARHGELQRIEQTLNELALIYQDLATIVEQQDVQVQGAERNAEDTRENLEKGTEQVEVGIKHAWNRRKLKWWLALVIFLIILVIAIAVSVKVCVVDDNCKSK